MKRNISNIDRIARLVISAILVVLYITGTATGTVGMVLLVAAIILTFTSLVNFCPIYRILGLSTYKVPKKS